MTRQAHDVVRRADSTPLRRGLLPLGVGMLCVSCLLAGCERRKYEPKPPAATPALPGGSPAGSAPPAPASPSQVLPPSAAPQAGPPPGGAPQTLASLGPISGPSDPANTMRIGGISAPKPVEWTWTTPPNAFRNLQYTVPAKGGAGAAAELIVSGFVGSDGGPLKQNIDRWVGSFAPEGEEPMAPILSEKVIDGMPVHLVELRGRFRDMGGASHPGSLQLGAIVEVPGGRVFIRLIGPESTVEPWRDAWEKLIEGMRKGESPAAPAR